MRIAVRDALGSHLRVKIHGAMVDAAANDDEAAVVARQGERVLADSDVCEQCSMSFRIAASNAFARVGDMPSARRHLSEAARISEMWQGGIWPEAIESARRNLALAPIGDARSEVRSRRPPRDSGAAGAA
jgi:hypothetical protein